MSALDDLWRDTHYAARTLRKTPAFAAVAVLTLALGIGVNTAVFSVVNAIIFRPLPVKDSQRLAVIATARSSTRTLGPVSFPDLQDYRVATHQIFEDIAGYSVGFIGLAAEAGRPDRVLVSWVTGNYFSLLGVRPALGRLIRTDEGSRGRTDPVVVLGHSTWQRRFGGDPSIVGRTAILNGRPFTIIGVVPAEFVGTFAFSESEVYLPVNWTGEAVLDDRGARGLHTVARLRPDVTIARAQAGLDVVAARLARAYPDADRGVGVRVLFERLARPEEDNARSNAFGAMVMLGLVGLVLLVAEVQSMKNALNGGYGLFAVRTGAFFAAMLAFLGLALAVVGLYGMVSYMTSERTHEIGVRVALGANPRNIATMVFGEGVRLTLAGTAIGLIGAVAVSRVLAGLLFGVAPTDPASFAFAALSVLIVTVSAMYLPAHRATRVDPVVALRSE